MMKQLLAMFVVGSVLCAGMAFKVNAEDYSGKTTLENLQAAFNGESNAKARYEAFAAKADEEGYKSVAALFRAASKSESIHAAKHLAVLDKMGAPRVKLELAQPEVKSTKENLEAALAADIGPKNTRFPCFAKQAEAEKNEGALYSFKGAVAAETEYVKFFQQALGQNAPSRPSPKPEDGPVFGQFAGGKDAARV